MSIQNAAESYDAKAVAALSEELHVPANDVVEVYKHEFTRLLAQARIKTYVGILAMSNTKHILHKTTARRCLAAHAVSRTAAPCPLHSLI